MGNSLVFDTLEYFNALTKAGISEEQAKAQVEGLAKALNSKEIATKSDIHEVKTDLKAEIHECKAELRVEIQEVKAELRVEIQECKVDIIKWMVGSQLVFFSLLIGVMGAIFKFLK